MCNLILTTADNSGVLALMEPSNIGGLVCALRTLMVTIWEVLLVPS